MGDKLVNSNTESLRAFLEEIRKFSVDVMNEMNEFFSTHQKMHAHWTGPQYDEFTEKFRELCTETEKEVRELMALRKRGLVKADELEAALNIHVEG